MVLVFDTNVFLLPEANLWELTDYFPRENKPSRFLIAVDKSGRIENEYLEYALNADEESAVRILVEKILDGTELFVSRVTPEWSDSLHNRLTKLKCTKPIEPELFGTAESARAVLVCPNKSRHLQIPRRFLDSNVLNQIQEGQVGPIVSTLGEVITELRSPFEYSPNSLEELKALLHDYRLGTKKAEEREFLEFKCPTDTYLSQPMLKDTVKAVCGMLNSRSGWVIIGVEDKSGEIRPFPPRYKSRDAELSTDALIKTIYNNIDKILPRPGMLVHVWPILDTDHQNCVVVIRVQQGTQVYRYKNTKWIRRGSQTISDYFHPGENKLL